MGTFIFYFLYTILSTTNINTVELLRENEVKGIKSYVYFYDENVEGSIDSILVVDRKLNAAGLTSHFTTYEDCDLVNSSYEYVYKNDTIRQSVTKYDGHHDEIVWTTYLSYNDKSQHVYTENFNSTGEKYALTTSKEYNKEGSLETKTYKRNDVIVGKEKYKYDSQRRLSQVTSIKKIESKKDIKNYYEIKYDKKGRESQIYEFRRPKKRTNKRLVRTHEYNDFNQIVSSTYHYIKIRGVNGCQQVQKGDELKRDLTYYDNGLVKSETEYLNGILNGTRKYFYEYE